MFKTPSLDKYRFYVATTVTGEPYKVVAVSSYAGRPVRGVAKCASDDKFDLETGKKLAAARCNQKIATKRWNRANKRYDEANHAVTMAKRHLHMMDEYYEDAREALFDANKQVEDVLAEM